MFKSAPLNQIYAINQLVKASKGEIIFLLDSDDEYKKGKFLISVNYLNKIKKLHFIQDTPFDVT